MNELISTDLLGPDDPQLRTVTPLVRYVEDLAQVLTAINATRDFTTPVVLDENGLQVVEQCSV